MVVVGMREADYSSMSVLSLSVTVALLPPLSPFLSSDTHVEGPTQFRSVSHGNPEVTEEETLWPLSMLVNTLWTSEP